MTRLSPAADVSQRCVGKLHIIGVEGQSSSSPILEAAGDSCLRKLAASDVHAKKIQVPFVDQFAVDDIKVGTRP